MTTIRRAPSVSSAPLGRRAFLARLMVLASSPVWLMGCARSRPLSVGIHPWIGYESLYLAREFGWLPPGVNLHEGKVASDSMASLQAGQIDAAALTLDEVLQVRAAGVPLVAVLVFDVSAGADMVLARPGIDTLKQLAGKRIGVERSAVGALMLAKTLEAAGLFANDVTVLDLPPDRQLAAWHAGEVDVVATYEPTASLLKREGAVQLFDSRQMPDTIFDVLAVRQDRVAGRELILSALLSAHFKALDHLRINRQDGLYRISAHEGIQFSEAQRALNGIELPDLQGNQGYLSSGGHLAQAATEISRLMTARGLLPRPDSLLELVDARYLALAEGENR